MKFDDLYESLMQSEGLIRSFKNLIKRKPTHIPTPPNELIPIGYRQGHTLKNPALADKLTKKAKEGLLDKGNAMGVHTPRKSRDVAIRRANTAELLKGNDPKRIAGAPGSKTGRPHKELGKQEEKDYPYDIQFTRDRPGGKSPWVSPIDIEDYKNPITGKILNISKHGK